MGLFTPGEGVEKRRGARRFGLAAAAVCLAVATAAARAASAETVRISGTGGAIEVVRRLAQSFGRSNPSVKIAIPPSMGSHGGIKAVLAGKLDIAVSASPLDEAGRARGGRGIAFAKTPFVFAVHRGTARTGVTRRDVLAIYRGDRTAWDDGSPIRLIMRPRSDSDVDALLGMWPEMAPALDAAYRREGMAVAMTDQDAADALGRTPGAFGSTTLALVESEKRDVRVLALEGVRPGLSRLADGSYPYAKTFYLVTGPAPSAAARRFIAFIRSPAGAAILRKSACAAIP